MILENLVKNLEALLYHLYKIEGVTLLISFMIMLLLGSLQVILRNVFNSGIDWADPFVRTLVLWVGFIGASLATRQSRHINIEVFSQLFTGEISSRIRVFLVNIFSLLLALFLLIASIFYLIAEYDNHMNAFLFIPTWVVFLIVPISTSAMVLRLFINTCLPFIFARMAKVGK